MKINKKSALLIVIFLLLSVFLSLVFNKNVLMFSLSTLFSMVFMINAKADVDDQEVDIRFLVTMTALSILVGLIRDRDIVKTIISGIGAAIIPIFFVVLSREKWMGYGDIFFTFSLGAYLGFQYFYWGTIVTFLLSGLFGIILLATRAGNLKSRIPLGPFVLVALIIVKLLSINFNYVFPF